ncbi:MAG TPA: glycerol-3-phosphate dehydrogenase/oxidase [Herpetosiphonaceae bacterium]
MSETRERQLARVEQINWDVIVIGGGINGAGIARDAALRGLRTLVVERGDWGGGTTSWSTRLIHGGLRYLEYAEIPLVRESLREREILLRIAPHLVEPLAFVLPVYAGNNFHAIPILRGLRYSLPDMYLAMLGYDILSFDKSLPRYKLYSSARLREVEPGLSPSGLRGGAIYYDGQVTYPERLCLESVLDAVAHGAVALNYVAAGELQHSDGQVRGVELHDTLCGTSVTARGSTIINCAGPWVDQALGELGVTTKRQIGGTKGSHIIVRPFPGAPRRALYIAARDDRRQFFIVPWQGLYLIGTTDTHFEGDLGEVRATADEVAYLLRSTNHTIPDANLSADDVLYTYSGVRPLPYVHAGEAGGITRRHILYDHGRHDGVYGLFSIIGGKITTYRSLAEHAVDAVCRRLGVRVRSRTATTPLPGAAWDNPEAIVRAHGRNLEQRYGLDTATIEQLAQIYGSQSATLLALTDEQPELRRRLPTEQPLIGAQLVYAIQHEQARSLTDVLFRRTMSAYRAGRGLEIADAAAAILGSRFGWSAERIDQEVKQYHATVERLLPQPHHEAVLLEATERSLVGL